MDLETLLREEGITPADTTRKSTKERLRSQAKKMLELLDNMKSPSDLDSKNSTANWWGNKPTANGKRYVCMKYSGNTVAKTGTHTDNNISAVRGKIEAFLRVIERSTDETWRAEEERRQKLKQKRKSKHADDDT